MRYIEHRTAGIVASFQPSALNALLPKETVCSALLQNLFTVTLLAPAEAEG
jgi:hypothetical protein